MNKYDTEYHDSDDDDQHSVASMMGSIKNFSKMNKKNNRQTASLAQKNPFSTSTSTYTKTENFKNVPLNIGKIPRFKTEPKMSPFSSFAENKFDSDKNMLLKAPLNKPLQFKKKGNPGMGKSGNFTGPSNFTLTQNFDKGSIRSNYKATEGEISRFSQTKQSMKFSVGTKNSIDEIVKTLNSFEDSGSISVDSGQRERISLIDYRDIEKDEIYSFDINVVISYIMQELGEEFSFGELKEVFLPKGRKPCFKEIAFFRHYELIFFPDGPDDD